MTTIRLSERARKLTSSAIREILKVTERPEVISFAGGLPSPATFPIEALQAACNRVVEEAGQAAFQYSATEGFPPLREWIAARHGVAADEVIITTGSQQALDLLGKVLIDSGSPVLVETPTYLGALQAFSLFEPRFVSVPSDDQGLIPEALTPQQIPELNENPRFLYALPNFQNPTGRRMPLERREALVARARELDLLIVEDDPYGELSYRGDSLPGLRQLAPERVVYLGSLSKILAPGLRLGYVIAPRELLFKLVQAKQAADLHTPSFTQRIAHAVLATGLLDSHIGEIRKLYATQCEAMLAALERHMPEGIHWNAPEGGMFIWVTLPAGIDSMALLERAVAANVAFVPGAPFYANAPQANTLRLAFVTVPPEKIEAGIAVLGKLLGATIGAQQAEAEKSASATAAA